MAITPLPTPPSRSTPSTFSTLADAFLGALPTFQSEANAVALAMDLNDTSDTSASSITIGTGAKTFVVTAGKSFLPGMSLKIARTSSPSNWMHGDVTTYATTSLVMNITTVSGSGGPFTDWTITFSAPTIIPIATAESDMIAAGPSPFGWVKKTLTEFKALLGLVVTAGKTITCTQNTSLDEAVAMTSKSPKESPTFTTKITTPIIALTGGQIAFPAAQAASADANTLDDYEEGTWTPIYSGSGGSIGATAYSDRSGYYTKIGRLVYVKGTVTLSNNGDWTTNAQITGLPFAAVGSFAVGTLLVSNITYDGQLCVFTSDGYSHVYFEISKTATANAILQTTGVPDNGFFEFTLTYEAAT